MLSNRLRSGRQGISVLAGRAGRRRTPPPLELAASCCLIALRRRPALGLLLGMRGGLRRARLIHKHGRNPQFANRHVGLQPAPVGVPAVITSVDLSSLLSAATNGLPGNSDSLLGTGGLPGLGAAEPTTGSSSSAGASTGTSKTSAGQTAGSSPLNTGAAQEQSTQAASIAPGGPKLNPAAITGVAIAGAAVGLLGGVMVYFFAVVRRKREDRRQWERLEHEKAAMQSSLDELRQVVVRQGTFDAVSSMESGRSDNSFGRKDSVVVNWKEGPQELSVPQKTYHELQGSDPRWEKM